MNIKQLEKEIIKAVDIEIDTAGSVGINDNNLVITVHPDTESDYTHRLEVKNES